MTKIEISFLKTSDLCFSLLTQWIDRLLDEKKVKSLIRLGDSKQWILFSDDIDSKEKLCHFKDEESVPLCWRRRKWIWAKRLFSPFFHQLKSLKSLSKLSLQLDSKQEERMLWVLPQAMGASRHPKRLERPIAKS